MVIGRRGPELFILVVQGFYGILQTMGFCLSRSPGTGSRTRPQVSPSGSQGVILSKSAVCCTMLKEVCCKAHPVPSRPPGGKGSRSDKRWRGGHRKMSPMLKLELQWGSAM